MATVADLISTARAELEEEGGLPDDPQAAADALSSRVRLNTAHLANRPSTRAVQREAANVTGAPAPLTKAEENAALTADDETRGVAGKARRARDAGKGAARATRGARRRGGGVARRALRAPGVALRGASSPRGVIGQMFALVFLYWLLRVASRSSGESFLTSVVGGVRRPFEWLFDSRGVAAGLTAAQADAKQAVTDELGDKKAQGAAQGQNVERWRPLVVKYFPASQVEKALRVMYCESRGNPDARNPTSDASGLFQHLPQFWPQRSQAAGFAGASIFDPTANVATAAWLLSRGGWGHWPNCGKL